MTRKEPMSTADNYRMMGYWFATGHWYAQDRNEWTPDFSSDFGDYAQRRRLAYDNGEVTSLPSIPHMWGEYVAELEAFKILPPPTGGRCPKCGEPTTPVSQAIADHSGVHMYESLIGEPIHTPRTPAGQFFFACGLSR